jgi:hypothetical protein
LDLEEIGARVPPGLEAQEPLVPFEVEAKSDGVAAVGERVAPDADVDPVVVDRLDAARCTTERMLVHDPVTTSRTVPELASAGDGRYAMDAAVEQHVGRPPRLCARQGRAYKRQHRQVVMV